MMHRAVYTLGAMIVKCRFVLFWQIIVFWHTRQFTDLLTQYKFQGEHDPLRETLAPFMAAAHGLRGS